MVSCRLLLPQVFFSAYIFNSNVMVKVATQPAENPIDVLSRKLHLGPGMGRDVPRLSLPGKLVFPRYERREGCFGLQFLHRLSRAT